MSTLVSLVSEQTIPNVVFIKQWKKNCQSFIFITTEQYKERVDWIAKAAGIDKPEYNIQKIFVSSDDYNGVLSVLENQLQDESTEYVVNITCGTKIMSIALFNYFTKLPNSQIYYIPISKNVSQKIYPDNEQSDIKVKLSLEEYFDAYGLTFEQSSYPNLKNQPTPQQLMEQTRAAKGRTPHVDDINRSSGLTNEEKRYLTGGWFEWYCYNLIKDVYQLHDKFIACGVKIKDVSSRSPNTMNTNASNEADVIFIKSNILYFIECKIVNQINSILQDTIYKVAAISDYLGKDSRKYIFTLADYTSHDQVEIYNSKMRLLGIHKIVPWQIFKKEDTIRNFILTQM